jgi:hypothetical protein
MQTLCSKMGTIFEICNPDNVLATFHKKKDKANSQQKLYSTNKDHLWRSDRFLDLRFTKLIF